jgi:hypothetical protein
MSHYGKYTFTESSSGVTVYDFISIGPKGHIKKVVEFNETAEKGVYFLAFGNITEDGSLDDFTTNNNSDRNKILATIVDIVIDFTSRFPDCYIYFSGSTKVRTRLSRMAIAVNYEELSKIFKIWGINDEGEPEIFVLNQHYHGFLIKRQ